MSTTTNDLLTSLQAETLPSNEATMVSNPDAPAPTTVAVQATTQDEDFAAQAAKLKAELEAANARIAALSQQSSTPAVQAPATDEDGDLFTQFITDPDKVIQKAVDKALVAKETAQAEARKKQQALNEQLSGLTNGASDQIDPAAFTAWLASSAARKAAFQYSAATADVQARAELINEFVAQGGTAPQQINQPDQRTRAALAAAGEPAGAAQAPVNGAPLSQRKIRHLIQTDPAAYNALLPEIRQAYAEGRVVKDI